MTTKAITSGFKLSDSEVRVLRHMIAGYEAGATPSIRQICEAMDWASPNAAHQHIRNMARKGLLELQGRGRPIRILPLALKMYGSYRKPAKEV